MRSQSTILASVAFFLSIFTDPTAASQDHVLAWPAGLPGWGYIEVDREGFAYAIGKPTNPEVSSFLEKMPEVQIVQRQSPAGLDEPCTNPHDFHSNEFVRGFYCLPDGIEPDQVEPDQMETDDVAEGALSGASELGLMESSTAPFESCLECVFKCLFSLPFCYHKCKMC